MPSLVRARMIMEIWPRLRFRNAVQISEGHDPLIAVSAVRSPSLVPCKKNKAFRNTPEGLVFFATMCRERHAPSATCIRLVSHRWHCTEVAPISDKPFSWLPQLYADEVTGRKLPSHPEDLCGVIIFDQVKIQRMAQCLVDSRPWLPAETFFGFFYGRYPGQDILVTAAVELLR